MKARRTGEVLVKVGLRLPQSLKEAMEISAKSERRSVNDQAIVLLEKALRRMNGGAEQPADTAA